jgi:hypothetical protein
LNGTNLPASFKVVIEGGGIPSAGLNNFLDDSTAPNSDNVGKEKQFFFFFFCCSSNSLSPFFKGTHWILLPDRGVCVGNEALASQNDGSYVRYAQSGPNITNAGPPVFANPESEFKRDINVNQQAARTAQSSIPWQGLPYGHGN